MKSSPMSEIGHFPLTEQTSDRTAHLSRLADAIRSLGVTALIALSATSHPVLYVRTRTRLVPVVVVEDLVGNQWFIWGRTGTAHVSQVNHAAAALCGLDRAVTRSRVNPVAARRAALREAA
ncbi:hypothetical protein Tfu_0705 [Thermobifida fusca YX]|uniref:Uncharacterized protein n=2 Tax=Thermobifida fusca TaxID=2021 RepID=Q47S24_THEFY|nr:hypothetical protein Tfu_0705 [Thermobifida fusca YX]